MQIDADSREDYFSSAGSREAELRRMDAIIQEHAPALSPGLTGELGARMLGYGEQPYQSKSMKEPGLVPVVALAAQKRYVSLYVCAGGRRRVSRRTVRERTRDGQLRQELYSFHQGRPVEPGCDEEDLGRGERSICRRGEALRRVITQVWIPRRLHAASERAHRRPHSGRVPARRPRHYRVTRTRPR